MQYRQAQRKKESPEVKQLLIIRIVPFYLNSSIRQKYFTTCRIVLIMYSTIIYFLGVFDLGKAFLTIFEKQLSRSFNVLFKSG